MSAYICERAAQSSNIFDINDLIAVYPGVRSAFVEAMAFFGYGEIKADLVSANVTQVRCVFLPGCQSIVVSRADKKICKSNCIFRSQRTL